MYVDVEINTVYAGFVYFAKTQEKLEMPRYSTLEILKGILRADFFL